MVPRIRESIAFRNGLLETRQRHRSRSSAQMSRTSINMTMPPYPSLKRLFQWRSLLLSRMTAMLSVIQYNRSCHVPTVSMTRTLFNPLLWPFINGYGTAVQRYHHFLSASVYRLIVCGPKVVVNPKIMLRQRNLTQRPGGLGMWLWRYEAGVIAPVTLLPHPCRGLARPSGPHVLHCSLRTTRDRIDLWEAEWTKLAAQEPVAEPQFCLHSCHSRLGTSISERQMSS